MRRYLQHLERRPAVALTASLGAALVAQYCFTGEWLTRTQETHIWVWVPEYTFGAVLLVCAIGLAAAVRPLPYQAAVAQPGTVPRPWWLAAGLAGALYAFGLVAYRLGGETALVHVAWLGGIVALLVPLAAGPIDALVRGRVAWRLWPWREIAAVGALTALALVFRAVELRDIPSHVDNDVALMGVFASRLIREGNYRWIGPSGSMHLLAYDQFLAWGMRLFGDDRIGLVTPSVLFGTATVPLTHVLGRAMFRPRVGLVAAGLLAGSYTHIHFSRILFGADTAFAIVLMVLMLYHGVRTRSPIWLAGAGVVCGLNFLFYDSARVMPLIALALFCWAARDPGALRRDWRGWTALAIGTLVAFGPMIVFLATSFRQFVGRGNAVALWSPGVWAHQMSAYKTESPMLVVLWQAAYTFLTFYLTGDSSPNFGLRRPMVAATTAILFTIGVGLCLRRRRDTRPVLLLAWIVLMLVFGGVLTYDPPSWPHLNAVLPAVALVAAFGADALVETWTRWSVPRRIAEAAVAATVVFTLATNWQMYYSQVRDNAGPRIRVARYLEDLPSGHTVYMLTESFNPSEYAFRFFGRNATIVPVRLPTIVSVASEVRAPCTFILAGYQEIVAAVTAVQPAAGVETHYDAGGLPVFVSITLDA